MRVLRLRRENATAVGAAVVIMASLLLGTQVEAAHPGDFNGRVVFSRFEICSGVAAFPCPKIRTADPDGSSQVELAAGTEPTWSPDGTRIAFVQGAAVVVMDGDGSNQQALVQGAMPAWSPDGTRLAYVVDDAIWTIPASGGAASQASFPSGCDQDSYPAWSQDGSSIFFVRSDYASNCEFPDFDIYRVGSGGGSATQRTALNNLWPLRRLTLSPDGDFFLVDREFFVSGEDATRREVAVVDASTGAIVGSPTQSGEWQASEELWPAWSPDDRRLVFHSTRDGGGLWTADVDGTDSVRMTATGGADGYPDWQPRFRQPTTTTAPTTTARTEPSTTTTSTSTTLPGETPPGETFVPSITLDRPVARGGEVVLVRGAAFPPAAPVTIRWSRGLGQSNAVPAADGTFAVQLLVFPRAMLGERDAEAFLDGIAERVAAAPLRVVPTSFQPGGFDSEVFYARR